MPRSIRILHVLHSFSAGGLENGIVNIINQSPEHLSHELCLLSKSGEFIERLTRPVTFHELKKEDGNSLGLVLKLSDLIRKQKIDILHTRNWAAFDAVIASCLTPGARLIHGEHGRDMSDPGGLIFRRNLARRLLSFRARKYVAVSRDLLGWLRQTVRIPERKLEFIPNGVDTGRFHPGRDAELRSELGIGANEFVAGTIGRLDPIKNHEGLINAIADLNAQGRGVRLLIVGDGPNRGKVEDLLRRSAIAPAPLLLGYRPDVERLYRVFDVFVLNSFAEGMSNTLLEAMASGLPIICTAVGGNTELIADRDRGIWVNPGNDQALSNAICEYMNSTSTGVRYAANARRFIVENYSLERMIERYVSLYESVA